jgi:hypothetical protein
MYDNQYLTLALDHEARNPRGTLKNQLLHHRPERSISYHFNTQAKVIRLRPKMASPLLPTSSSSSKTGRAGSLYSFEDSYSRGGNGNGVEAYTLPKGERGLPLVLRRLGKFKSMVRPLPDCIHRLRLMGGAWIAEGGLWAEQLSVRGREVEMVLEFGMWADDRISNLHFGN